MSLTPSDIIGSDQKYVLELQKNKSKWESHYAVADIKTVCCFIPHIYLILLFFLMVAVHFGFLIIVPVSEHFSRTALNSARVFWIKSPVFHDNLSYFRANLYKFDYGIILSN